MSLPLDGPLSFSEIGAATGVGAPYSLTQMSANAGFGQPDAVSEFYGYGPGGLTLFYRTFNSHPQPTYMCFGQCDTEAYHNGVNPLPNVGDIVYNDSGGSEPIQSLGDYWGMAELQNESANGTFTTYKRFGEVLDALACFFEGPEQPMFQ